ncbi:hypothetical protein YC2023_018077 [Brassica napus]
MAVNVFKLGSPGSDTDKEMTTTSKVAVQSQETLGDRKSIKKKKASVEKHDSEADDDGGKKSKKEKKHKRVSDGDEILNTESSKVNDGCQNHEKAFVNSDDDGSKRVKKKRRRVDCDLGNTAHKPKRKKKKSKEKIKTENREAEVKKSTKDPKDKRKKQKDSKSNEVIYEVSLTHESLQKELKRANMELASQATDMEEERAEEISAMQLFIHLKERELEISIAAKRLDQILFEGLRVEFGSGLETLNNGDVPTVTSFWQSVEETEYQRVYDSGIETYLAAFDQLKASKEGALREEHEEANKIITPDRAQLMGHPRPLSRPVGPILSDGSESLFTNPAITTRPFPVLWPHSHAIANHFPIGHPSFHYSSSSTLNSRVLSGCAPEKPFHISQLGMLQKYEDLLHKYLKKKFEDYKRNAFIERDLRCISTIQSMGKQLRETCHTSNANMDNIFKVFETCLSDYEASSKGPGKWQKFSVFLQQSLEGPIDDLTKRENSLAVKFYSVEEAMKHLKQKLNDSKEYRERITKLQKEIFMSQSRLVEGFMRKKVSTRKTQRMNKEDRTKIALIKRLEELKHLKSVKKREFLFIDEENVHKLAVMSGVFDALVILICNSSLTSIFHMISAKPKTTLRFMELGLVNSTMEMFVDSENIISEKALLVLDTTCESNEGRTIVSGNKLVMLILLKISEFTKKNLISVMWKICKPGDGTEVEEAFLLGVLKKLVVMLQVGCGEVTKECDEDDEKPDFNKKDELLGHPEDWDVFQGGDGLTPTRKEVSHHMVSSSTHLKKTSRRLPGSLPDDFQEVFSKSLLSYLPFIIDPSVLTTSKKFGSLPDDFKEVWKSSRRLQRNLLNDFQEVFQTTSMKSSDEVFFHINENESSLNVDADDFHEGCLVDF